MFIGGCQRSGTTLLRELLGRHPHLACGAETGIFYLPVDLENLALWWGEDPAELAALAQSSGSVVGFADVFFGRLLKRTGKPCFVDKAPGNVRAISKILTWYPRARFLLVVRDGRDVVCSLRHYPPRSRAPVFATRLGQQLNGQASPDDTLPSSRCPPAHFW